MTSVANRILVWSGTGFVGRALFQRLVAEGYSVTSLSRGGLELDPALHPRVQSIAYGYERNDEAREILLRAVLESDLIFNLAGSSGSVSSNSHPLESLEANCAWQLEFLQACAKAGHRPRVVFASSRLVYGKPLQNPVDESHPIAAQSIYAAHKHTIEQYHQIYADRGAIEYTICRIAVAYGRHPQSRFKNHGFLNTIIEDAMAGKPLRVFGSGEQVRDYIHIEDLVSALWACGISPEARNEVFNVGSGEGVTILDAVQTVANLAQVPVVFEPWPESFLQVETGDFVTNISKLKRRTGFEPKFAFHETLRGETAQIRELRRAKEKGIAVAAGLDTSRQ